MKYLLFFLPLLLLSCSKDIDKIEYTGFSPEEIEVMNTNLFDKVDGYYVDIENGERVRFYSFIDMLLLNLTHSNKSIIFDNEINLKTAVAILFHGRKQYDSDLHIIDSDFITSVKKSINELDINPTTDFGKDICPPPNPPGQGQDAFLWNPKLNRYLGNVHGFNATVIASFEDGSIVKSYSLDYFEIIDHTNRPEGTEKVELEIKFEDISTGEIHSISQNLNISK